MRILTMAGALLLAAPTMAQTPEPARLASAKALVALVMPPAVEDQMTGGTMRAMMDNMRRGFTDAPQFKGLFARKPEARALFDKTMDAQQEDSIALLRQNMPALRDAVATAYARRFSEAELAELRRFFASPAGQRFAVEAPTVMVDPDVMAVQRNMMQQAMDQSQRRVKAMVAELQAMADKPASGGKR